MKALRVGGTDGAPQVITLPGRSCGVKLITFDTAKPKPLGTIIEDERVAEAWGWIARNPVRSAKKPRKKNARRRPVALSVEQIEALRAAMPTQRDAALVRVLAYGGLRPGEALALRWGDFTSPGVLRVSRSASLGEEKGTKTGRERTIHLLSHLHFDMRAWWLASGRPGDDEPVFPAPDGGIWDDGRYRRWRRFVFKPAVERAGLGPGHEDLRPPPRPRLPADRLGHERRGGGGEDGALPRVCLSTYAHAFGGREGQRIDLREEIARARGRGEEAA